MGKIILILADRPAGSWKEHLLASDPVLHIDIWPHIHDHAAYDTAVVWKHPAGLLKKFPNLRLICSLGAGVDHILADSELPKDAIITRVVDEHLTRSMSNYIIMAVLNHQRQLLAYRQQRSQKQWQKITPPEREVKIGFLGLGVLGSDAAIKLTMLGFEVHGFSRHSKKISGLRTYSGRAGLEDMLKTVNVLVNLLPLTSETSDLLNLSFFEQCTPGTYLINVARGEHLAEGDLMTALDQGWLSGAMLDVFREEPLPGDHPFWQDDRIMITPHIASVTKPASAAAQIAENHRRLNEGEALLHTIDRSKEY